MVFEDKEIRLKDGRTAILRSPVPEDAGPMLEYLRQAAGETPFLMRTPEECTDTLEQEQDFIRKFRLSQEDVMLLCIVGGRLAGTCHLSRLPRLKTRHRGTVGIGLVRDFWNLGIGTAMFQELLAIARSWGLSQLELEFVEGNTRAQALYEKMGFQITGARPNAFRLPDGTMLKEFQMTRPL